MRFEFATAGRIIFGPGAQEELGTMAGELGQRVLVVRGSNPARSEPLLGILEAANLEYSCFEVHGEPTVEQIAEGVNPAAPGGIRSSDRLRREERDRFGESDRRSGHESRGDP